LSKTATLFSVGRILTPRTDSRHLLF